MRDWLRQRFGISTAFSLLGALISGFGGVWVFAQENQFVGISAIVVFIGVLVSIIGAFSSGGERTKFERELRERSDEIADLNRQIAASVTGGDSFCYLTLASLGVSETNSAILTVVHQGEYPLYDVRVRITDLQEFQRAVKVGEGSITDQSSGFETDVDVGNLGPHTARAVANWRLPDTDEQGYNVFFNARNGFFTQFLRCKRVNGYWKVATRIRKESQDGEPLVLHERVDSEYPRNGQGDVDWD